MYNMKNRQINYSLAIFIEYYLCISNIKKKNQKLLIFPVKPSPHMKNNINKQKTDLERNYKRITTKHREEDKIYIYTCGKDGKL